MPLVNLTGVIMANSTVEIFQGMNGLTGGIFGLLFLIAIGIIVMINLSFHEAKDIFLVASFFMALIGGYAFLAGLVPLIMFIIALVLTVVFLAVALLVK